MKAKLLFLAIIIVFSFMPVAGNEVGVFPIEDSKSIKGMKTRFEIGFINLGNTSTKIIISPKPSSNYQTEFRKREFYLEPSKLSQDPDEEGEWFNTDEGYAKIRKKPFNVSLSPESGTRSFKIPIKVNIVYKSSESSEGLFERVYQQRELNFYVNTTSSDISKVASYEGQQLFADNATETDPMRDPGHKEKSRNQSQLYEGEKKMTNETQEKGLTQESEKQDRVVNKWTLIFSIVIVLSLYIILREA